MIKLKPYQQGLVLCRRCGNEYKTPPRLRWRTDWKTGKEFTFCQYCYGHNFDEDVLAVENRPAREI